MLRMRSRMLLTTKSELARMRMSVARESPLTPIVRHAIHSHTFLSNTGEEHELTPKDHLSGRNIRILDPAHATVQVDDITQTPPCLPLHNLLYSDLHATGVRLLTVLLLGRRIQPLATWRVCWPFLSCCMGGCYCQFALTFWVVLFCAEP